MIAASATRTTMATKRSSSAKENKQPIDPAPDADLNYFVLTKPGPSKKAQFAKPLSETQMTSQFGEGSCCAKH